MLPDQPQPTTLLEPIIGPKEISEAKNQKRLLDAKIEIAEDAVRQLYKERQAVEDALWMPATKAQAKALLEDGSYGCSIDVMDDMDYRHRSWAKLNEEGEMLIGGFLRHDHFRSDSLYIRKDIGRFS